MMLLYIAQGYGWIAVLLPALMYAAAWALRLNDLVAGVAIFLSAVFVWFFGRRLNRERIQRVIKNAMGRSFRFGTRRHTVFFLPMEFAAIPIAIWGLYLMVLG